VKCVFGVEINRMVLLTLFRVCDWWSKLAGEIEIAAARVSLRCDSSRRV